MTIDPQLVYRDVTAEGIDGVRSLWERLNIHHANLSPRFGSALRVRTFDARKHQLLAKAGAGKIRVDLVSAASDKSPVAYCISTVSADGVGEVDSIFVEEHLRGRGVGTELMRRALSWLENVGATSKIVSVISGNDEALAFYRRFGFHPRAILLEESQDSLRFIRYQPEYQEPMLALHRSAIEGFTLGMTRQQDEADLMAIGEVYLRAGGEFLIGFIGDRLVAMGGFKRLSGISAELRRMRIARELQGRGYGTLLLQELEGRAFQSGVRTFFLDTAQRRPLTLKFYRKHGYQETGQGFYGAVETVQFSKTLDERVCGNTV